MNNFFDGVRIACVVILGIAIVIIGIVVYALASTWETLVNIVKGKR